MPIGGYFINGYSFNGIDRCLIGGYWCLLMVVILVAIGCYSINGYW